MLKLQLELISAGFFIYIHPDKYQGSLKVWGYFDEKFKRCYIYRGEAYQKYYTVNIFINSSDWVLYNPLSQLP